MKLLVDILLYAVATMLVLYLLLNLVVYLVLRHWMRTTLRNLRRVLEEDEVQ